MYGNLKQLAITYYIPALQLLNDPTFQEKLASFGFF